MQTPNHDPKEHLTRHRQIKINVFGRKSGKAISIQVWSCGKAQSSFCSPRTSHVSCDALSNDQH
jgi:hypothetical protein